jgi:hypothetical protein
MRSNRAKIIPAKVTMFQFVNIAGQTKSAIEYYEFEEDMIVCIKVDGVIVQALQSHHKIQAQAVQKYHATVKLLRKNELTLDELEDKFLEAA